MAAMGVSAPFSATTTISEVLPAMVAYARSPDYQCQPHHYTTIVAVAAVAMERLRLDIEGHARSIPGQHPESIVVEPPRTLVGLPVPSLVRRGELVLQEIVEETYLQLYLGVYDDQSFTIVKHLFNTAYLRSCYGRLLEPVVTVEQTEALEAHLNNLDAQSRSETTEDVYADVFMVIIGQVEPQDPHGVRDWLTGLIRPVMEHTLAADLDLNSLATPRNMSRRYQFPATEQPEGGHPSTPIGFPALYRLLFRFQRLSDFLPELPHKCTVSMVSRPTDTYQPSSKRQRKQGKKRQHLNSAETTNNYTHQSATNSNSNTFASTSSAQVAGPSIMRPPTEQTMKATTSSALNAPGNFPVRSWLYSIAPPALPTVNNDASPVLDDKEIYGPADLPHSRSIKFDEPTSSLHAPKNTVRRDPTSPKSPGLFGSPRISLRSPGLFGSPASSFAHSFSSASSTSSIASFFKKGKAKLTSSDSFRRLADLVTDKILPPRNSTRHPRSADSESELVPIASSSHPTSAGPQPPSLEPVTRQPLVSRQPPSASPVVKRSLSQTDIVEKPSMNVVLKKLKFTKTKRSNTSPALP